jgi:hypothetical protein
MKKEAITEVGRVKCFSKKCDWEEEGRKCNNTSYYRTHWYMYVCKDHGSIMIMNHGIDYLIELDEKSF